MENLKNSKINKERRKTLKTLVHEQIGFYPQTVTSLCMVIGAKRNSIAPRVTDLYNSGLVKPCGQTTYENGVTESIWTICDKVTKQETSCYIGEKINSKIIISSKGKHLVIDDDTTIEKLINDLKQLRRESRNVNNTY